jgi:aspartyl-tRNA synthetase
MMRGYSITNLSEINFKAHIFCQIGLDRLLAIILGTNNIRDSIAFPKTHTGCDATVGSPSMIKNDILNEYGLTMESKPLKKDKS